MPGWRLPSLHARWRDSRTARLQTATFAQLWRNFESAGSVLDGRHDTDRWRSQDGSFAAAIVPLGDVAFELTLGSLTAVLEGLGAARVHPRHFLHIMVQELGVVTDHPRTRRQIAPQRLDEFCDAAESAIGGAAPFELIFGGVNAFRDAVILEVHDQGVLSRLHRRLHELAAIPVASPYAFLPHVTVAHFTSDRRSGDIVDALRPWRDTIFGYALIDGVEVVTIDTTEAYPRFAPYRTIRLSG
jgi:2'-5' RNA ligase